MIAHIKAFWQLVRRLSGDDAYEHYLSDFAKQHPPGSAQACHPPLSKAEFFKQWQEAKWNGVKRCC